MNKRLIGSLVGGGVTLTVATLGGLKIHDTVDYNNKISYFGGLRSQLNKELFKNFKNYTVPKWQDMGIWKSHYQNNENNRWIHTYEGGRDVKRILNSPEELRDACYGALPNKEQGPEKCNPSSGWCVTCLLEKGWHGTDNNY